VNVRLHILWTSVELNTCLLALDGWMVMRARELKQMYVQQHQHHDFIIVSDAFFYFIQLALIMDGVS